MGSLGFWRLAAADPEWVAVVEADGLEHRAGELLARVNQLTRGLRELGLAEGDGVAVLAPNGIAPVEVYLAAAQAGWYVTPVNWHFTAPEIAYIVRDSGAKAFFVHERFARAGADAAREAGVPTAGRIGYGQVPGFRRVDALREGRSPDPPPDRTAGSLMFYTSGTTGRPKGVRRQLAGAGPDDIAEILTALPQFFGITPGRPNVHLVTSPHYHTAVTQFATAALHMGHCLVFMDDWDSEQMLALVERHRVTNTHMVPTQFTRLLALPEATRRRYDLSSMRWLLHAAAPCPPEVKRQMLAWWGPCIYEYYAATEGGGTIATPQDWLERPGTVGRPWPVSEIMIAGERGEECPPGVPGTVYMRMTLPDFVYKGDPAKTAAARLRGFFTVGDIGYLDADGYLFLCGRVSDMIISGGVNIYPAEIEAEIIMHPQVVDVAVFGIPDQEWGEQVKAVIQPADGVAAGPELAASILASLNGRLARLKWPRSIDFIEQMPRDPSGKLLKRRLREQYSRAVR
jgi:long-chain acyl-CoA synthetase